MIEPRRFVRLLRRQSSSSSSGCNNNNNAPTSDLRTIYLAGPGELEYETLSHGSSSLSWEEENLHTFQNYYCPSTTDDNQHARDRGYCSNRSDDSIQPRLDRSVKLLISFLVLVLSGTCHSVVAKLQTIPFYNYPNFLNLFSNLLFIPICFAYIIPVSLFGLFGNVIPRDHHTLAHLLSSNKHPFVVLGALDCLATSMQIFSSVYLPGPLMVLLPQAAIIPLSMILSRYILRDKRYQWKQYAGAAVVLLGILIVLEPFLTHRRHASEYFCEALDMENDCVLCQLEDTEQSCLALTTSTRLPPPPAFLNNDTGSSNANVSATAVDDSSTTINSCRWLPFQDSQRGDDDVLVVLWAVVMIASTIPMALSTIYKQMALGEGGGGASGGVAREGFRLLELDPIFLSGWTAVFQFPLSVLVAFPAGLIASPSVRPADLPRNLWEGFLCTMMGVSTIETGCHPDSVMCGSMYPSALFYVVLCLCSNVLYMVSMMFLVKYGSAALLFLALTVIVPLSNLSFALLPASAGGVGGSGILWCDVVGLLVIIAGLVLYRFADDSLSCMCAAPAPALSPSPSDHESLASSPSSPPRLSAAAAAAMPKTRLTSVRPSPQLPLPSSLSEEDLRALQQPLLSGDV